jgi:hypothetical protein
MNYGPNYTKSVPYGNHDMTNKKIIYNGCIYVYAKEPYRSKLRELIIEDSSSDELCDFGTCDSKYFFDMISIWRKMDTLFINNNLHNKNDISINHKDILEEFSDLDNESDSDINSEIDKQFKNIIKNYKLDPDYIDKETNEIKKNIPSYISLEESPISFKYVINIFPNDYEKNNSTILTEDEIRYDSEINEYYEDKRLLGFCNWKCFDISYHLEKKQHKYVNIIWPVIKLVIKSFKYIRNTKNSETKKIRIKQCCKLISSQADIVLSSL